MFIFSFGIDRFKTGQVSGKLIGFQTQQPVVFVQVACSAIPTSILAPEAYSQGCITSRGYVCVYVLGFNLIVRKENTYSKHFSSGNQDLVVPSPSPWIDAI